MVHYKNGSVAVIFNQNAEGCECGKGGKHWFGSVSPAATKVTVDIDLNAEHFRYHPLIMYCRLGCFKRQMQQRFKGSTVIATHACLTSM